MCCVCADPSAAALHKDMLTAQDSLQPNRTMDGPLQALYMVEDVQKLKNLLATERNKNNRLLKFMEKKMLEKQRSSMYVYIRYIYIYYFLKAGSGGDGLAALLDNLVAIVIVLLILYMTDLMETP